MRNDLLGMAALLPAFVLCAYVYKKDRREKEPPMLLFVLAIAGAVGCFPAALIESTLIDDVIEPLFAKYRTNDGSFYASRSVFFVYLFLEKFIGVALVEESVKWISLVCITKNNKNYNSLFDGLIYAIFVSLGFAALENVFYVIMRGWRVAALRAVLSVPGHMFFAVFMGYHYSLWNIYDKAAKLENELVKRGGISRRISPFSSKSHKWSSIIIPVGIHGFYNFCCSINSTAASVVFVIFMISLYIRCFYTIKRVSRRDKYDMTCAKALVFRKYKPETRNDSFDELLSSL